MYITLSIIDIFLFCQVLLEQYILQRLYESMNFSRPSFGEMVEVPADDNCINEQVDFPLVHPVQEKNQFSAPQLSQLDDGAKDLLSSIEQEISQHHEDTYSAPSDEDCPPLYVDEMDCLSIDDINETTKQSKPGISFEKYPPSKIKERLEGKQNWIATVIGKEENYLHINDGSRIWAKLKSGVSSTVNIDDVLLLDVRKDKNSVIIERFTTLETRVSNDYKIPDEDIYLEMDERLAI